MKWTIRPLYFDSIRPGALEGYLEDMAQRGWRLRKICCGFGLFDATAPQNTRYRVENVQSDQDLMCDELNKEEQAFYQEGGWTYLHCMGPGQHLFRADDPNVPEFHTDHEIEADTYRELLRREKRGVRISAVFLAVWLLIIVACTAYEWNHYGFWGSWIRLVRGNAGMALWGITFVICLIHLILRGRRVKKLGRLVREGRLEQDRAGWRRQRRRQIARPMAWWLCLIVLLAGIWWIAGQSETLVQKAGLPTVTLSEIQGQRADTSEWTYLPFGFTRRYYSQQETIERDEDQLDILLSVQYYELYDWMPAGEVTQAIADQAIGLNATEDVRTDARFDQFYCDRMEEGDYVSLTARKGNRVMSLLCIGGNRNRAIELVAEQLAEN